MKKSEVTKRRIIKATQELVNEKGLEGASVREIAKKASVNVASINYYFSKKENLMGEILLLNSEELGQTLKSRIQNRPPSALGRKRARRQPHDPLPALRRIPTVVDALVAGLRRRHRSRGRDLGFRHG
ncbi:MAG TPA: TetR/AcrR family transcriptional regulator [Candidatus Handelsmanbacteria bacterium]|nr:TetR/AcrR family transcriptional regulator [Candidatus Handelsmanbacteria bacterium]